MKRNILIGTLFCVGLLIFTYPFVSQLINNYLQASQVKQFKNENHLLSTESLSETIETARICNESIFKNEDGVHDPFTEGYNRDDYRGCTNAPPEGEFFAAIEIPTLQLNIPIYVGATEEILAKGVGQVEGSSLPVGGKNTHTVLAGHRGMGTKEMFRHLDQLQEGDQFYIYTVQEKLTYQVFDTEVILPHETETLEIVMEKDLASLITCHPYRDNTHRLVVHGNRIN